MAMFLASLSEPFRVPSPFGAGTVGKAPQLSSTFFSGAKTPGGKCWKVTYYLKMHKFFNHRFQALKPSKGQSALSLIVTSLPIGGL